MWCNVQLCLFDIFTQIGHQYWEVCLESKGQSDMLAGTQTGAHILHICFLWQSGMLIQYISSGRQILVIFQLRTYFWQFINFVKEHQNNIT